MYNHPSGNTFSGQDIFAVWDYKPQVFEVVTATNLFRLAAPVSGWPDNLKTIYRQWYRTYHDREQENVVRGKIEEREKTRRVYAKMIEKVAAVLRLKYEVLDR